MVRNGTVTVLFVSPSRCTVSSTGPAFSSTEVAAAMNASWLRLPLSNATPRRAMPSIVVKSPPMSTLPSTRVTAA